MIVSVANAQRRAQQLLAAPWQPPASPTPLASSSSTTRTVAIGDLQAPFERLARVLAQHGLLADDGRLANDVRLVAIGDYFDFGQDAPDASALQGWMVLRWLAEHPPEQAVLLIGNHDLARVSELAGADDEAFGAARAAARALRALPAGSDERTAAEARWIAEFPRLPLPALVARDYASFLEEQRTLMQRLLLARRMRLACAARLADGTPVLLTHAGVLAEQLVTLGLEPAAAAETIAAALDAHLDRAVESVAEAWRAGAIAALDLAPLHVAGNARHEGGGLLYHRPSLRHAAPPAPGVPGRRFMPSALPKGLAQACGHTRHPKCVEELEAWVEPGAEQASRGRIRTLQVRDDGGVYAARQLPHRPDLATLHFIDGELAKTEPHEYELLALAEASIG
jgi:hypothetical protein